MATNRKFCSDVIGILNASNIDERISFRLIIGIGKDIASTLIKQDSDNRRLFGETNLWKNIPCLELEDEDLVNCNFDVGSCKTVKKSKIKLPDLYTTVYGNIIKITNLDGSGNYQEVLFDQLSDYTNRRYKDPNIHYFWIVDNYLYIADLDYEAVRVTGFFKDNSAVLKANCITTCTSPLDMEFNCPEYLFGIIKQKTADELKSRFRQVDEKPNANSGDKGDKNQP